jgi:5S rRNA maturation endonuclease (ribonuclease M5)
MKHSFLVPPSIAPGILEDLLAWKLSSGFKLEGVYKTTEDDGKDFFTVRCKNPSSGQKYFSDVYFNDSEQAWKLAAPSERWRDGKPLYGRHVLETQVGEPVIVVEGQHKVDALLRLGIRAVTSGGASTLETASRQDIEALCSNNIIVWQDNDEPGRRWYQSLLEAFSKSPVRPRLVERIKHEYLDLPEGGDVVDWVQRYPDAQAEDVLALERQVVPLRTAETLPLPTSFDPLRTLSMVLGKLRS